MIAEQNKDQLCVGPTFNFTFGELMEAFYRVRDPADVLSRFRFDSVHRHHHTMALFTMFNPFPRGYCRCCGTTEDGSRYSSTNSVESALKDYYAEVTEVLASASLQDLRSQDLHPSKHDNCYCSGHFNGARNVSDSSAYHTPESESLSVLEVSPKKRKLPLIFLDDSSSTSYDELE